jgi:uroporphyrin-3 C-methyltransferase
MKENQTVGPADRARESDVKQASSASTKRAGRSVSAGLALILAAIALVLSGSLWYLLSERQGLLGTDVMGRLDALSGNVAQIQKNNDSVEQRLARLQETQDTLKTSVSKLSSDVGRSRRDWLLADTEQLLVVANERLQLTHDVTLALAALRVADHHLQQLANPNLLPVRRSLARDISQLEATEQVDVDGLALQLNGIATRIDRLPLAMQTQFVKSPDTGQAAPQSGGTWIRFLHEMWRDMSSLIRVRTDTDIRRPLLAPDQSYFLRENLRLVLFSAQLAVLQRDATTYQQNIKTAIQWLNDYFDTNAQVVTKARDELQKMARVSVRPDVPDLSSSLEALQKVMARQETP